jgi:hypothetical protein
MQQSQEFLIPRTFQIKKKEEECPSRCQLHHYPPQWDVTIPFFLMNNQSLAGNKKTICLSNQDDNYEVGNPDDTQLDDDLQIDLLLGDMLNSTQDQAVLQNDGHSQSNTSTLSQLYHNTSILHHPSIHPIIEASKPFNLDAGLPSYFTFQMALAHICDCHRTDMKLFNEINKLIQQHSIGQQLSFFV